MATDFLPLYTKAYKAGFLKNYNDIKSKLWNTFENIGSSDDLTTYWNFASEAGTHPYTQNAKIPVDSARFWQVSMQHAIHTSTLSFDTKYARITESGATLTGSNFAQKTVQALVRRREQDCIDALNATTNDTLNASDKTLDYKMFRKIEAFLGNKNILGDDSITAYWVMSWKNATDFLASADSKTKDVLGMAGRESLDGWKYLNLKILIRSELLLKPETETSPAIYGGLPYDETNQVRDTFIYLGSAMGRNNMLAQEFERKVYNPESTFQIVFQTAGSFAAKILNPKGVYRVKLKEEIITPS